jgi:pheromone shutdown protein TraB
MRELKSKIVLTIRWIAVLPVAIGAFILANYATTVVMYIGLLSEDGLGRLLSNSDEFYQFINSITGAIAFIWAGTKTAPKYRLVVAISLTGLFCGLVIAVLFLETCMRISGHPLGWFITCALVSIVAAVLTCGHICRKIVNEIRNRLLSGREGF